MSKKKIDDIDNNLDTEKKIKKSSKQKDEKQEKKKKTKKEIKKEEIKKEEDTTKEEKIREVVVERKTGFNYIEVIVIMIITLILGAVIGSFITYIFKDEKPITTSGTSIPTELEEFVKTYNNIVTDYYEDVDHDKLLEAGINGMLEYLDDDYSMYMDTETSENFNEQVEGKYKGIGVEIMQTTDGVVSISKVFKNTPASKAGLKVGDIFVKVLGTDVTSKNSSEISTLIKNSKEKEIDIVVKRDGEEKEFKLSLDEVEIESVTSKVFEQNKKKIGYIDISVFASNTATQFEKKLLELEGKGIDSLVIDVRDNSGGYLSTVTDIASLFMNKSKVIYQLDTKGVVEQIYSKTNTSRKYSISVLINQNSASASEILAAALQESYRAKVVGVNSFGKGTVQKAYQLESGATVKYTIQKWLTPNGNWINEKGVTPDIEVEMEGDYYQNPSDETDNQLQKALEDISK